MWTPFESITFGVTSSEVFNKSGSSEPNSGGTTSEGSLSCILISDRLNKEESHAPLIVYVIAVSELNLHKVG